MAVDETALDQETMGRLAKAVSFILGEDHQTTRALRNAGERGFSQDLKQAQTAFNRMSRIDRQSALGMIED